MAMAMSSTGARPICPTPRASASPTVGFSGVTTVSMSSKKMSRRLVARAAEPGLNDKVAESIKAAEETCAENAVSAECKVAWEEVEELSAAVAHKKVQAAESGDPLDKYCKDNPETDECRVYED